MGGGGSQPPSAVREERRKGETDDAAGESTSHESEPDEEEQLCAPRDAPAPGAVPAGLAVAVAREHLLVDQVHYNHPEGGAQPRSPVREGYLQSLKE